MTEREKNLIEAMKAIHELKPDKSGTLDPFTAFYLTVKRLAGSALIDAGEKVECENTNTG